MSPIRSIVSPRSVRHLVSAALALGLVAACSGKDPYSPGTQLGTFHVTAKLTHTSCGETPNPWNFDIRLNHDGSTLYWVQTDAPPIEGRVDSTARTQLQAEVVEEVRAADPRMKREGCAIARTDVLALTLVGPDAQPTSDPSLTTSFSGGLVYTFAPTTGSDCADQVTMSGGGFDALPCEIRYDLTGALESKPR